MGLRVVGVVELVDIVGSGFFYDGHRCVRSDLDVGQGHVAGLTFDLFQKGRNGFVKYLKNIVLISWVYS